MGAPCTLSVPGTVVSVVKSISEVSECVPVNLDISVDFLEYNADEFLNNANPVDTHLAH